MFFVLKRPREAGRSRARDTRNNACARWRTADRRGRATMMMSKPELLGPDDKEFDGVASHVAKRMKRIGREHVELASPDTASAIERCRPTQLSSAQIDEHGFSGMKVKPLRPQ